MDISMYSQQNNGYSPTESNYINCISDTYTQNHLTSDVSSQHYSNAYPYEEPYIYSPDSVGTPPPQEINCYNHPNIQNNSIINTDSGLSYTNLDYSSSNSMTAFYPTHNHQGFYPSESYQKAQSDVIVRQENTTSHQVHQNYLHHNKYINHSFERDIYQQAHVLPQNADTSCMEYQQQLKFKEENLQTAEGDRHNCRHAVIGAVPTISQPVVPTYKWMQVKRNVPKPPGKILFLLIFSLFFFIFLI